MIVRKGGNGLMDAGSIHGSAAKGSGIDLEVAGSGTASCFPFPLPSLPCVVLYLVFHFSSSSATVHESPWFLERGQYSLDCEYCLGAHNLHGDMIHSNTITV